MGRLKPGIDARRRCRATSRRCSSRRRAAGLDALPGVALRRGAIDVANTQPHGGAAPARRVRRRGVYDVNTNELRSVTHPQRRRRAGAADRLRQRREPAAVARDDAAEGTVGAAVARRDARAADPAAADREPAARGDRRRARASSSATGASSCCRAPPGQAPPLDWRVLAFVLAVTGLTGHRLRHRAGAARHRHERELGAQGDQPQRGRLAQRARQVAARRAGRDLARAAGRRRPVPAHAAEPAARRRRLQPAEPAALPRQPAAESLRREAHAGALPRACSTGSATVPGRARRWRCRSRRCSRAASTAPASSSRAAPTRPASATATTTSTAWWSRRTSSR